MNKKKILFVFVASILITGAFYKMKNSKLNDCIQNYPITDSLLMTKIFGNYDSELKLSFIDSTHQQDGVKHSLSVPGVVFYNKYFVGADSNECILITESPFYYSESEYKKKYDNKNLDWLDSLQKLVKKKYKLVCSDCHACGVAMGYYVFHKEYGQWKLHESYPKFDRLGAFGRFYGEINLLKIGQREYGLFITSKGGSQGESIRYLRIYNTFNGVMKVAFTKQMYYSNEGAVGKPEKILSQKELSLLDEYDREMYHRSLDYIEEKSPYELIDRSGEFFDLQIVTQKSDAWGEQTIDSTYYILKNGAYLLRK
jgi:hypothetical protein